MYYYFPAINDNVTMPLKAPKKGSKGQKKTKKPEAMKRPAELQRMSDSDAPSESLLDTPGPMQAGSNVEEGEEASQRPAAQATQATQSDSEDDDDNDGALPRKKINVSQEQELVEFFAAHPLFYDQMLKEFNDRSKKDRLLAEKGADLGMTGGCTFFINRSSKIVATL